MKTVTVHRGARDGYQVARALQEVGLLETLVTDLYWPADRTWARSVESIAPRKTSVALRCRHAEDLPSSSVASCWMSGLGSLMANKARWFPFHWERGAIRWCDRSLGRQAGRIATEKGAALLSYSYYAHSAFSHLVGDQPRILFQLHPHPASVRSILQQERRLHPDCASSLDKEWELALPESDFHRLVEEVAMAQHWIAASHFTKQTLVDAGIPAERIAVIPYGIQLNVFSWKREACFSRGPLRLLFVGTLGQRKGIKYLVQALELLPPGSVELMVCGRAVDDLAIFRESRVAIQLYPSISAQGLLDAYRAADVFVFPSLAEGFAHVLLEAMASGLPIVASGIPVHREVAADAAVYFDPFSPQELAMAVANVISSQQLRHELVSRGADRVHSFSWDEHAQRILEVVDRLCRRSVVTTNNAMQYSAST
jgi:glycosyltransferase involved in cell wall biosynthesis